MAPLVIACGDPSGIGPEVALAAVAAERRGGSATDFVLVGDAAVLAKTRSDLRLDLPWQRYAGPTPNRDEAGARGATVRVLDPAETDPEPPAPPSPKTFARAALRCLRRSAEGCLRGEFSALVTAPVSKERIIDTGIPFVGQTEFLAELAGIPEATMMLLGDDDRGRWLRVALVTTHLPLARVPEAITEVAVVRAIRDAADACRRLGLARTRIGVAGLNPHAGEGGKLGDEEIRVVAPAIAAARRAGHDVHGPVSGDTLFHQALHGQFDAVVAMYHDQGLAPLKLVAFERGVNWSLGLPFVRTSPDHGTAFDIAGRGIADPSSMRAAIRLAASLAVPGNGPSRRHGEHGDRK
ncbi:MAG: 4-hydroxythreonine-4-phosphate dehydrogenase PdxA [Verrucomicrobiales bacterium]|nr:4-hydroxythreonine-4-phosphate dehydrogenase PdxA [Verrucomicrobiales bacterium]